MGSHAAEASKATKLVFPGQPGSGSPQAWGRGLQRERPWAARAGIREQCAG